MSMPSMTIKCDDDKGIENVSLDHFPCVPHNNDSVWINGCEYIVVKREYETNNGSIDGSAAGVIVHLKHA